jgi:hypothetical protein
MAAAAPDSLGSRYPLPALPSRFPRPLLVARPTTSGLTMAPDGRERGFHVAQDLPEVGGDGPGPRHEHHGHLRRHAPVLAPICLAHAPSRPVPHNRSAHAATGGERHAAGARRRPPQGDEAPALDPATVAKHLLDRTAAAQPFGPAETLAAPPRGGFQSCRRDLRPAQTVSRFRPFARRRFSTLRPPLVFILCRKPWVFLRRR